jgi:hypothetical protein
VVASAERTQFVDPGQLELLVGPQAYDPPVTEHLTTEMIGDYAEQAPEPENAVAERVNEVLGSKARADLHALLQIEPFYNSQARAWDAGWSCRDHSVVLAALLTAEGVKAQVVHGNTAFVQGSTPDGEPSMGTGLGGHSWLRVPAFGTVDISPRLSERSSNEHFRHWRPLPVDGGLIGEQWDISGMKSLVVLVDSAAQYEQAYAVASHASESAVAIYWPQKVVDFSPDMLDGKYIDSPLTHRFVPIAGADGYVKLAAHLYGVSRDIRPPLARISQRKAWRFIAEIDPEVLREFQGALDAGLSAQL